ncbi:MAG: bifunctional ornithine acetyltransferase/N-acetylglutamate synthase, partial [Pseudomonadota bacterium]
MKTSPLAPARFPDLPEIEGVTFATIAAGVKYAERDDVMLVALAPCTSVAGVFTRSATRSANVLDCQAKIHGDGDGGAAIIVNSGNSNAFTGRHGDESVRAICTAVADALDIAPSRVFTSSTGVIGERLEHERIVAKVDALAAKLSPTAIRAAAQAITTTDTFPKGSGATIDVGG